MLRQLVWAIVLLWISSTLGQECDPETGVCDKHERCSAWKEEGECVQNRAYMLKHCPVACGGNVNDHRRGPDDEEEDDDDCQDEHERCSVWAGLGECEANPDDMLKHCAKSCDACGMNRDEEEEENVDNEYDEEEEIECEDTDRRCSSWAKSGECKANPNYMHSNCAKSCGTCGKPRRKPAQEEVPVDHSEAYGRNLMDRSKKFGEEQKAEGAERTAILDRIESTIQYIASEQVTELPVNIRRECKNRHELCTFWQVIGECEKNQAYMQTNCAAACQSCEMIDHAKRCPIDPDAVPALLPGSLNQMFQRVIRNAPGNQTTLDEQVQRALQESGTPIYTVQVHSRPSIEPVTDVSIVQDRSLPPWVITFDNFLTDEECDALIQLGYKYEYKRSEDVGPMKFDGSFDSVQQNSRTSENAWCSDREGCRAEEVPQRVHKRMAAVMDIPPENSEDLQVRSSNSIVTCLLKRQMETHMSHRLFCVLDNRF